MYSEDLIGEWVRKAGGSKVHYVESLVSGELLTNCGRRLKAEGWHAVGLLFPKCKQCAGADRVQ